MTDLKEPTVLLEGVRVEALHLKSLELLVKIQVQNPNPIAATLQELTFSLMFHTDKKEEAIATGKTGRLTIPANDSVDASVPVTTNNSALMEAVASLVERGTLKLEIRGNVVIEHIVANWAFPFSKTVDLTKAEVIDTVSKKVMGKVR